MAGSFLEQGRWPKVGEDVWVLAIMSDESLAVAPVEGWIRAISDIDNRGLGNVYVDVQCGKTLRHTSIRRVFDHRPQYVQRHDEFGPVMVWE